jgi:hypothetical protein
MLHPEQITISDAYGNTITAVNLLAKAWNDAQLEVANRHPLAQCEAAKALDRMVEEQSK